MAINCVLSNYKKETIECEIRPQDKCFYEQVESKPKGDREWVVFQGEFADLKFQEGTNCRYIFSSFVSKCHFLALYHFPSQTACCAHIDDLTSLESVKNRFVVLFECKYSILIDNPSEFKLTVFNGEAGSKQYLEETEQEINELFKSFEIEWIKKEPTQLQFDCSSGQLYYGIDNPTISRYIQIAQRIERNIFFRFFFPADPFDKFGIGSLTFTEARISRRDIRMISDKCEGLRITHLPYPISLTDSEKAVRALRIKVLVDIPRAIADDLDKAFSVVSKLCPDDEPLLKDPLLKSKDFGLTLRRAAFQVVKCGDDRCKKLFMQLISSSSALKLDLTSTGRHSGTVFNVIRTTKQLEDGSRDSLLLSIMNSFGIY